MNFKFYYNGHTQIDDVAGVYAIVNLLNNKKYIGSSTNLRKRYRQHYNALSKNKHVNIHLQNAFNKYGEDKFEFWILETCDKVKDTLIFIEQKYIDSDGDYNICKLASHHSGEVYTGHVIKDDQKKCIAESNKNRIWSKESREKISIASKNSKYIISLRKKILQFDLNDNLIAEYSSITDAAMSLGNINRRVNIKRCCRGNRKTAYNYKWKYKNDNEIS